MTDFIKVTEQPSNYRHLDAMSVTEILTSLNNEDKTVPLAVEKAIPQIEKLVNVIAALRECRSLGIITGCIVCNPGSPLAMHSVYPIEVVVGPEFVTGSTRMKSGTAQKLVLNMISTSVMIQLGKVRGNKMVDMQLSNEKLVDRGIRMVMNATGAD